MFLKDGVVDRIKVVDCFIKIVGFMNEIKGSIIYGFQDIFSELFFIKILVNALLNSSWATTDFFGEFSDYNTKMITFSDT